MPPDEVWQFVDSSQPGGIETHVRLLACGLRRRGVATRVMFLRGYGAHPLHLQLAEDGTPFELLDGSFRDLLRALRRRRPALLHTHGYKAGILGRIAARCAGVPSVHTYHAGEPGAGRVCWWHRIDRWSGWLDDLRIAVSAPVARSLPWPSLTMENFVEVGDALPRGPWPRRVTFLGRLSEEKGPDLFCEIAAACSQDIEFEVYGDGPMRAALQQRFGHRVNFRGFGRDIGAVFARSGLLLMPSRHEGLPLAALEAMAAGVPVAAAAVGGLPVLISDQQNGLLFPPGDVDAAVAVIAGWDAMPTERRLALARHAHQRVATSYGLASAAARLESLYRDLLRAGAREPAWLQLP